MAIFDVIEVMDEGKDVIVQRWPAVGSGQIKLGSQLIVRDNQWAVFFRDGKALDALEAGRHTLTTGNIPFLAEFIGKHITDGSPFKAEVYFVTKKPLRDLKWGTPEPVIYREQGRRDGGAVRGPRHRGLLTGHYHRPVAGCLGGGLDVHLRPRG